MINRELLPMLYQSRETVSIEEDINEVNIVKLKIDSILDLCKDVESYIDSKSSSTYNYSNGYWGALPKKEQSDDRTVYFYEWSDLKNKPLIFTKVSVFKEWCDKHGVNLSDYTLNTLKENKVNHCACWTSSTYICVKTTLEELNNSINWNHAANRSYQNRGYDDYYDWD